jgi:hypothetical protein
VTEHRKRPLPGPPELEQFIDAQERRYDPSAWLGGDLDPIYRSPQSKRVGVLLLVQGAIALVIFVFAVLSRDVFFSIGTGTLTALFVIGGVRKLRSRSA